MPVFIQSPYHIQVDHYLYIFHPDGGILHQVFGPDNSHFFGTEGGKEHGTRRNMGAQPFRGFKHTGNTRGIIIRTMMNSNGIRSAG